MENKVQNSIHCVPPYTLKIISGKNGDSGVRREGKMGGPGDRSGKEVDFSPSNFEP